MGHHVGVSPGLFDLPFASPTAVRVVRLIWLLLVVIESVVGLRVLFRAMASKEEGFVRFVYLISVPFVAPFRPIVTDQSVVVYQWCEHGCPGQRCRSGLYHRHTDSCRPQR